jgi:hypothetical protein
MKIDNQQPLPEEVEIVDQKQVKKEHKLVATIVPHRGHTLWEINTATREIKPAQFEAEFIEYRKAANGMMSKRRKVIEQPGCVYVSALNQENAMKKLFKQFKKSTGRG